VLEIKYLKPIDFKLKYHT